MNIADQYQSTVDLAVGLINIPSVTGSEAAVLDFLEEWLSSMGLDVEREAVETGRWNLYGGWNRHADVVFCTHVDTVPPAIPARIDGDILYGRGACDTKGIIAAMLFAGKQLIADGYTPSYLFVVGEETDSIGAKTAALSDRTAQYIIVGEPTDNMLATGHKGVLSYTLTTHGVAAHSAYPDRGSSAVHVLLDLLEEIRKIDWGNHPVLGDSTVNIGLIQGGVAMNTFAPEAQATVMHRVVDDPGVRREEVLQLVGDRAQVVFHSISDPQILTTVDGFPTKPVAFGTDIPYLRSMGKCVLFGPGSIHDAHTSDEHIAIPSIHEAINSYIRLYHALR
jgi:acetylornithine deacetylase